MRAHNRSPLHYACRRAAITFYLLIGAVVCCAANNNESIRGYNHGSLLQNANRSGGHLGHAGLKKCDVEMMPIYASLPSTILSGESLYIALTVASVPSGGGSVQVLCTPSGVLESPGGSWPYQLTYACGASTTADVTLRVNPVVLPTLVTIYMGTADANPSDLSEWTNAGSILVLP